METGVADTEWLILRYPWPIRGRDSSLSLGFENFETSGETNQGFLAKQEEHVYFCIPFTISSLWLALIFTHVKCSKFPQVAHTPTAALFCGLIPVKLHTFATHLASPLEAESILSSDGPRTSFGLALDAFLWSSLLISSFLISSLNADIWKNYCGVWWVV